jgi:hypothetical protein
MRWLIVVTALLSVPAVARDSLGVYDGWGAFRDTQPFRCFAIAAPESVSGGKWKPFATVSHWPAQRVRGQIHIRLSRTIREGAKITLTIDDRRASMIGSGADVWAPSRQMDAAIVAAMRSGRSMSIETVASTGGGFADAYRLKGAASAIDAAALGCARAR